MKQLLIIISIGISPVWLGKLKAQTNVNIEKYAGHTPPKTSLKFIEDIEIVPEKISSGNSAVKTFSKTTAVDLGPSSFSAATGSNIEHCSAIQFKYGIMLDREVESITNLSLYNFIDDWMGTRYHYGGQDKGGIDCSGFTGQLFSKVFNITLPRTAGEQITVCDRVDISELAEGDLVFFNTRGGISHVGVYLGNNFFVHSSTHDGVKISSLTDAYYSRKFVCGGKYRKQ